jgi:hypothetical protein
MNSRNRIFLFEIVRSILLRLRINIEIGIFYNTVSVRESKWHSSSCIDAGVVR